MSRSELLDVDTLSADEVQRRWEEAYVRFETPQEEIRKFVRRLHKLGQSRWPRDARIVEVFCGRGNGLKALESLGFTSLEGVDISGELISRYNGPAILYEADCRELPFESSSKDVVIVQGGLHHLPRIPEDLERTLSEIHRVLTDGGSFVMVEPWLTPFLRVIHLLSESAIVRSVSGKFDAFAAMTHYEATTYFNWLSRHEEIDKTLAVFFPDRNETIRWGKKSLVATKPSRESTEGSDDDR